MKDGPNLIVDVYVKSCGNLQRRDKCVWNLSLQSPRIGSTTHLDLEIGTCDKHTRLLALKDLVL